jgi:pimeloyl-ACP methyl ester carboxylesterase
MDVQAVSVEQPHPAMVDAVRLYGPPPYRVVLVHGGPGGAGEMSPLARTLGGSLSLVEAMQTKLSIADLIDELREQIAVHAQGPAVLVGHSWGAWLCLLLTARHPEFVERLEMATLEAMLADPKVSDKGALFDDYGYLFEKTENYDAEPEPKDRFETDPAIFDSVWPEAAALRTSGELLRQSALVKCPVLAIHGDYDPSPADGVREPLARVLTAPFEFIVLKNCGHTPWLERGARAELFETLTRELHQLK